MVKRYHTATLLTTSLLQPFKVTVDLQGCLPKNHSYAHCLYFNHRKVYIIVKLIKCRIRRNNFFKIWFNGKRVRAFKRKTHTICYTELPAFLLASMTKQTAQCQSVADRLQKGVRLFRYFDWLTIKSFLKLANWIFADLDHCLDKLVYCLDKLDTIQSRRWLWWPFLYRGQCRAASKCICLGESWQYY